MPCPWPLAVTTAFPLTQGAFEDEDLRHRDNSTLIRQGLPGGPLEGEGDQNGGWEDRL